jgi:hypothetical protein
LVFPRLQPYKKSSLKKSGAEKLKLGFYGPYRIIHMVGEVSYELELLDGSQIHNVFHVSVSRKSWHNSSTLQRSFNLWIRRGR